MYNFKALVEYEVTGNEKNYVKLPLIKEENNQYQ